MEGLYSASPWYNLYWDDSYWSDEDDLCRLQTPNVNDTKVHHQLTFVPDQAGSNIFSEIHFNMKLPNRLFSYIVPLHVHILVSTKMCPYLFPRQHYANWQDFEGIHYVKFSL
jgi:hypothetical protein